MEGRASNFKKVLADFESRLRNGAEFVAIDTELTGVDISGEPDTFEESAQMRLEKNCRIAERYTLIQVGFTIVSQVTDGVFSCASYNLFAFPYMGPELLGYEPGFFCQASALQFNAQHHVDFNKWIKEGIPYMNRADERRHLKGTQENGSAEKKTGLLLFWKALCAARLPFVVHCPLDLFFLLAAFERRPLPRKDPRALAQMIRHCTPKVFDTAHLHGALGQFKRLALLKFFEDAKARYDELKESTNDLHHVPAIEFRLEGETATRYSKQHEEMAHEAGFDSLLTAQLFLYLRAIAPTVVKENVNRLFLYRSVEFVDLDRIAQSGQAGTSMFDLTRVTLLVAVLDEKDGNNAASLAAAAGATYKWMDATHILVVLRASGGAAVRKAAELAAKVHGVQAWMGFDEWRCAQAASLTNGHASTALARSAERHTNGSAPSPPTEAEPDEEDRQSTPGSAVPSEDAARGGHVAAGTDGEGDDGACLSSRSMSLLDDDDDDRGSWTLAHMVLAGAASAVCTALVAVILMHGRSHFAALGARFLRRWRSR